MNDNAVKIIGCGPAEECFPIFRGFLEKNDKLKAFPNISTETKKGLYPAVFARIREPATSPELLQLSLNFLRVLSRERSTLEQALDVGMIDTILKIAGLKSHKSFVNCGYPEMLESLKVIFNMVFQSPQIQEMFVKNELLEGLVIAVKEYDSPKCVTPLDVRYFTLRVLFIITALCQTIIPKVRQDLKGLVYLNNYLRKLAHEKESYSDQAVDIICETQKVLYNLIHDLVPHNNKSLVLEEKDSKHLIEITQLVRLFLLHDCKSVEKKEELNSHSIDLLAGVTNDCFAELIVDAEGRSVQYQFEKNDLGAIEVIATFLHHRLEGGQSDRSLSEALAPVLSILIRMVTSVRVIRKYLKKRILPPLTKADVMERPEVGNTLRNKLCVLLTSPGYITELVSTFLFTLCKENVPRLVKYTGFGNAAGLLANRGLLLTGKGNSAEFSDDSEDSDTEEYKKVSPFINDVEGRVQVDHPDPFEGMSEEQKEHEAMELVKAIDSLNRRKVIQPCRIGPDGKPQPVEHICELLDSADASSDTIIRSNRHESSDSD